MHDPENEHSSFNSMLLNLHKVYKAQVECEAYARKIADDLRPKLGHVNPLQDYLDGHLEADDFVALHELGAHIVYRHRLVHELLVDNMAQGLEFCEHLITEQGVSAEEAATEVDRLLAAADKIGYEDEVDDLYHRIRHDKYEH